VTILGSGLPTVYFECPLPKCDWRMQGTPVDQIPIVGPFDGTTYEAMVGAGVRNGMLAAKAAEEKTLRAHLDTHPIEEWARAVVELDTRVRKLARAGEVVAEAERWKVVIPAGTLKCISETDARRIAAEHHGEVYRSTVTLYADGSELLGSWQRVRPV
jgi:hypothetical protein